MVEESYQPYFDGLCEPQRWDIYPGFPIRLRGIAVGLRTRNNRSKWRNVIASAWFPIGCCALDGFTLDYLTEKLRFSLVEVGATLQGGAFRQPKILIPQSTRIFGHSEQNLWNLGYSSVINILPGVDIPPPKCIDE